METPNPEVTKKDLEAQVRKKGSEVWQWADRAKENAAGELPNGKPVEDYDTALAAMRELDVAVGEMRSLIEALFSKQFDAD